MSLYCLVTLSLGSSPAKRARMLRHGATSCANSVTSSDESIIRFCISDLLKYSENVSDEMINFPLGITVIFFMSAVPSSTSLSLSSKGH